MSDGVELSDGGTICYPDYDGTIKRIDYWGNTMERRRYGDDDYEEWNNLFYGTPHYFRGEEE